MLRGQSSLPDSPEQCSFVSEPLIPIAAVIVLLVCQERPDVDVAFSLLRIAGLRVVDNGDEPISVLPDIEDDVAIDIVSALEVAADLREIVPANGFDDRHPSFDLVCGIGMLLCCFIQVPTGDDVHKEMILHKL